MISAIAVIGKNRELGCDNKLLWDIPDDLAHFKKITSGHPVIMGRKTFESIGSPLPGRINIIITRDENYKVEGCEVANSLEAAIKKATQLCHPESRPSGMKDPVSNDSRDSSPSAQNDSEYEIFIIGGGQIYKQALPFCDKLYLTIVEDEPNADTYFPDYSEFKNLVSKEKKEYNGLVYSFVELIR